MITCIYTKSSEKLGEEALSKVIWDTSILWRASYRNNEIKNNFLKIQCLFPQMVDLQCSKKGYNVDFQSINHESNSIIRKSQHGFSNSYISKLKHIWVKYLKI